MCDKNCNGCGIAPLCTEKHSLCDTCRKVFVCPMQHIDHREKCGLYEPLPNPLDEIVTETRSLNPIKEENNMEAWEQVEKARAEGKKLKYDEAVFNQEQAEKLYNLIKEHDSISVKEKKMEAPELVEKSQAEIAKNAWKDRLKEEYAQLKERYEKLKAYNIKLEVKANIAKTAPKDEEYYCNRLLARQQEIMADYLKVLELRAELAHIEL